MPDTSTVVFLAGVAAVALAARLLLAKQQSSTVPGGRNQRPVTEDMVTIVQTIIPHADRDSIRRSLLETHSIEDTTTQLLERHAPRDGNTAATPRASNASSAKSTAKPSNESLLQRYGVSVEETGTKTSGPTPDNWYDHRSTREEQLRQQRQDMVRKARQHLLEMEAKKNKA